MPIRLIEVAQILHTKNSPDESELFYIIQKEAILAELGLEAALDCGLCLGEGTGALLYLPALLMAEEVYRSMSTFSENQIEEYQELT